MDIFDLALQYKDFGWLRHLTEAEKLQDDNLLGDGKPYEGKSEENERPTLFDKEAVALEKIITRYAVKEKNGVRAFNINSDFDRTGAELIIVENVPCDVGDMVKYYIPTGDELTYMRGTVNGYYMGYRDAYRAVNRDYLFIYELGRLDGNSPKISRKKSTKKTSKKENKQE